MSNICRMADGLTEAPEGYIGDSLERTAIAFIVVNTVFVVLRCLARYQSTATWGWEDYMVPLALFSNIGMCVCGLIMVYDAGVGQHVLSVCLTDPEKLKTYATLLLPFSLFLNLGIGFSKIAILGLYLRIFIHRRYVYTTYALIVIQVAAMIAALVVSAVLCLPLTHLTFPEDHPNGHCINVPLFWQWGNLPQAITDLVILILPFPTLVNLKLTTRNKIGVIITMMTGSVGLVVSIVRPAISESLMSGGDITYQAAKFGSLSIAESGAYLIATCLPTFRSLFRWFRPAVAYSHGSQSLEKKSSKKPSKYSAGLSVSTQKSMDEEELVPAVPGIHVQREYQVN